MTKITKIVLGILLSLGVIQAIRVNTPLVIYDSPMTFEGDNVAQWREIEKEIITAPQHKIILRWDGYGGSIDQLLEFNNAIDVAVSQGKEVIFAVNGIAASAHAFALCHGTGLVTFPGSYILYHHAFRLVGSPFITPTQQVYVETPTIPTNYQKSFNLTPGGQRESDQLFDFCQAKGFLTPTQRLLADSFKQTLYFITQNNGSVTFTYRNDDDSP